MIKISYDNISKSSKRHINILLEKLVSDIKADKELTKVFATSSGAIDTSLIISILVDPIDEIKLPIIHKLKTLVDYSRHMVEYDKLRPLGVSRKEALAFRLKHFDQTIRLATLIDNDIFISTKNEFETLNSSNTNKVIKSIYKALIENLETKKSEEYILISKFKPVFNYDKINGDYRHEVLSGLSIKACPYCNRQYITTYTYSNKRTATADLDHFYPKSHYPFYALSLYNFIPSCQICNSRLKGDKVYGIVYPYKEYFGNDGRFKLNYPSAMSLIGQEEPEIEIVIESSDSDIEDKIKNSIKMFRLEELYEDHTDLAREIVFKKEIYDRLMTKELETMLSNKDISILDDQFIESYYGNYLDEDSQSKRPLSKLTSDIIKELSK